MASVPAEVQSGAALPATTDDNLADEKEARSDLLLGFNKLTILRQLALIVGVAASIAMGLWVVLWMQEPSYKPLLTNISGYDPSEVSQILQQADIPFKVEPSSGVLLVESGSLYNARLKLAAAGITEDRTVGFEILDKDQGLGTSQFMESTRYRRGLEGELARTIANLRNVKAARVHLAIPKQSVFVRDNRKPSASVLVDLFGTRELERGQVEAIVNLIASSVPEMDRKDVTVVDQRGRLLSDSHRSQEDLMAMQQFEYNRKVEETLNNRITGILEPILGAGHFRSEVSADLDFTAVEQAEELFNPDQKAVRSEQVLDEQRQAGINGGVPGALSNQPPGAATSPQQATAGNAGGAAAGTNPTDVRKQATRNYEVDRTVSYTKHDKGKVTRLTVAVAVDDIRKINAETGEVSYQPWPAEELQRLTILVRDAVGYSAARGDSVNVINTPFAPVEEISMEAPPLWEQPWFLDAVKYGLAFVIVLVLVFGLLRPTLRNLSSTGAESRELALAADEEGLAELERLAQEGGAVPGLEGPDEFLLPGSSGNLDRQLNALKSLVGEDPGRVAQVIRQWVNADD